MGTPIPIPTTRTVTVPVEFLDELRRSTHATTQPPAVEVVRDAGHAAGQALFDHFAAWLSDRGEPTPEHVPSTRFDTLLREYFVEIGWGVLQLSSLGDAVMVLDASHWGEATEAGSGCPVSTGLFAGFFGRLADAPLAVLEVTPGSATEGQCRFLLASVEVLNHVWEVMARGIPYEQAAASA